MHDHTVSGVEFVSGPHVRDRPSHRGPVVQRGLFLATWNCHCALAPKLLRLLDLLLWAHVNVCIVQECDVIPEGRASVISFCSRMGYRSVFFSAPTLCHGRLASQLLVISDLPLRLVDLALQTPGRHLAMLASRRDASPLLIVGLYAPAGHSALRDVFLYELLAASAKLDRDTILLGDWNASTEEGVVGHWLANGRFFALDDAFQDLPHTTVVSGSRRLDFALGTARIHAVARRQFSTPSDHDCVVYHLPDQALNTQWVAPVRTPLAPHCDRDVFFAAWHLGYVPFQRFLQAGLVDDAWTWLSDIAEDSLQVPGTTSGSRRSSAWVPTRCRAPHKASPGHQPVRLRRLLRVERRLLELVRRPEDLQLRYSAARSCRSLGFLYPPLLTAEPLSVHLLLPRVSELRAQEEQRSKSTAVLRWHVRLEEDPSKQRRWIRQGASQDICPFFMGPRADTTTAAHPTLCIEEAQQQWLLIWNRPHPADRFGVDLAAHAHALADLYPSDVSRPIALTTFQINAANLQRAACKIRRKAAGPDGWRSVDLLALPVEWWTAFAQLWCAVLLRGLVPLRWCEARLALIPKPDGGMRPISIIAVAWRLGTMLLARQFAAWWSTWASPDLVGALPGRHLMFSHARIIHSLSLAHDVGDGVAFVTQDITKAYDSVHVTQALAALSLFGAPGSLLQVLSFFYGHFRRVFTFQGCLGSQWQYAVHGLPQGCPCSPLLLGGLMALWSFMVHRHCSLHLTIYLDDRTLWSAGASAPHTLRRAVQVGDTVDERFGFRLSRLKCHTSASTPALREALESLQFDYGPPQPTLDILGLHYDLAHFLDISLLHADLAKSDARLRRIATASKLLSCRRSFVRTLVLSAWVWAAGLVVIPFSLLFHLRRRVISTIWPTRPRSAAIPLLLDVVVRPDADPFFCYWWSAFGWMQRSLRESMRLPLWKETLDVSLLCSPTYVWTRGLQQILYEFNWSWSSASFTLSRVDSSGARRLFRFGTDSIHVLRAWLLHVWRSSLLASCVRVQQSFHRYEDPTSTALGLILPAPPSATTLITDAHAALFATEEPTAQRLAVATGLSCWFCTAGRPSALRASGTHCRCMCWLQCPSFPHLLWNCAATQLLRDRLCSRLPLHRAEERTLCCVLPELPAPGPFDDSPSCRQHRRETLLDRMCLETLGSPSPVFATDGAAAQGHATWAVTTLTSPTFADELEGEDVEPLTAEIAALASLVFALARAVLVLQPLCGLPARAVLLFDCQSAERILHASEAPLDRFRLWSAVRDAELTCLRHGLALHWHWIPSHAKVCPSWHPPFEISESQARSLNAAAHHAAHTLLQLRIPDSQRSAWFSRRDAGVQWARSSLQLALQVHALYSRHLDDLEDDLPFLASAPGCGS
jgi:hypothetical protein